MESRIRTYEVFKNNDKRNTIHGKRYFDRWCHNFYIGVPIPMIFNKIETEQQALEVIKIISEVVAIDTEYVKGDPRTTQLLSIIIADGDRAWSFTPSLLAMLTPMIRARKLIFLQDYNRCDTIILLKHGCDLRDVNCHNLVDMHHLLDENADHSLGARVLSEFKDNYKKEFWGKYKNFEDAPYDEALEYECKDAIYTYRLGIEDLSTLIAEDKSELYGHVRKLSKALLETTLTGLRVDLELMKQTESELSTEINSYLPKLREEFNEYCEIWEFQEWSRQIDKRTTERGRLGVRKPTFSFTSDTQVSWLVYEALKSPVVNKTKKGAPSTNFETLEALARDDKRLESLVRYKDVKSLYGTFVKGMLERVENGLIHPNFNVSGTTTGRISHSNPNMGNLPKTGRIRNFFIPRPGMVLIGADYSQLEVVVEANLTDDPQLLKIINEGASKHDITANGLSIPREQAKTLNFALQYGAGVRKVSQILNVPLKDAQDVFDRYWKLYSGVKNLKDKVSEEIKAKGQITNLAGRTRRFEKPEVILKKRLIAGREWYQLSKKFFGEGEWEKRKAKELDKIAAKQERQGYNFLIQGVAAEACNRAFYRISNWISSNVDGRALFSVHDEILCEVPKEYAEDYMGQLVKIMEQSTKDFNFKHPLLAKAYGPLTKWEKT